MRGFYICILLDMQTLRKIMVARELIPLMDIPHDMRSTQVEVIVLPISSIAKPKMKPKVNLSMLKKLKGSLSKYANANLRSLEENAFEMAVEEDYRKGKYNVKNDY
jgi:hypothetical protein